VSSTSGEPSFRGHECYLQGGRINYEGRDGREGAADSFSGPMVRAIREDRKTQTRRLIKPQPDRKLKAGEGDPGFWFVESYHSPAWKCPYGKPGDRLWVRETWKAFLKASKHNTGGFKAYDPSPSKVTSRLEFRADQNEEQARRDLTKWRPSIFMPRWASRITLEVTGVRVERLQEISEADAKAEGIEELSHGFRDYLKRDVQMDAVSSYESLWESINGAGSWDANPWVWVIEFKRLEEARA
jgi:hypothetical protein